MPKPMTAPGIDPASSPTDMTTSGVRSALTPNTETCETAAICTITVTRAIAASRRVMFAVGLMRRPRGG